MDPRDFFEQAQSESFIQKELAEKGLNAGISLEAQIEKEVLHLMRMYVLLMTLSLGLLPAAVVFNSVSFTYLKEVTRCDHENPYQLYCKIKAIEPSEFACEVLAVAKTAASRGWFNPWSLRLKLYLVLAGIGFGVWHFWG